MAFALAFAAGFWKSAGKVFAFAGFAASSALGTVNTCVHDLQRTFFPRASVGSVIGLSQFGQDIVKVDDMNDP